MPKVILIVREPGRLKPDYSLDMDLPEIPHVGSYISVQRPDNASPWGEDMIVRAVWWRLDYPGTIALAREGDIGKVNEVYVECDMATGPWSSDHWRGYANARREAGDNIPEFEVARISFRQSDVAPKK